MRRSVERCVSRLMAMAVFGAVAFTALVHSGGALAQQQCMNVNDFAHQQYGQGVLGPINITGQTRQKLIEMYIGKVALGAPAEMKRSIIDAKIQMTTADGEEGVILYLISQKDCFIDVYQTNWGTILTSLSVRGRGIPVR